MWIFLKKILNIKTNYEGKQIDFDNAWIIDKINNRENLLEFLFENTPEKSVWSIEGVYNKDILNLLSKFAHTDETKVALGTVWPKQIHIKILLTNDSKFEILKHISNWDLSEDIVHQHIYKEDVFYLTSFDNLSENCTWISKNITKKLLENLKQESIIDFYDSNENR